MELDLGSIKPSVAGPKRPHDRVEVAKMKEDFTSCLSAPVGFKGFNIAADKLGTKSKFTYEGKEFEIQHGSVVISAITSCTNTSNPSVML
jgi:aconitate hydratase